LGTIPNANPEHQTQTHTKYQLAFEQMIDELETTKQQLSEKDEALKVAKEQLAHRDEEVRTTRQEMADRNEQCKRTEIALGESKSQTKLMECRNSVLVKDISALMYEGGQENARIRRLKWVLEREQRKVEMNAEADEKSEKLKELVGSLSVLIFGEPEQPNVDAEVGPILRGEPMAKINRGNATVGGAMAEPCAEELDAEMLVDPPDAARMERASASLRAEEGEQGEMNEVDMDTWLVFGHGDEEMDDESFVASEAEAEYEAEYENEDGEEFEDEDLGGTENDCDCSSTTI